MEVRSVVVRRFDVTAMRDGRWWVFEIPELGTGGQARSLADVDYEAQGVAAMWLDVPPEEVAVDVTVDGLDTILQQWADAEAAEVEARNALGRAAAKRREVVASMRQNGWSVPDAGRVLGISKQRVSQLTNS